LLWFGGLGRGADGKLILDNKCKNATRENVFREHFSTTSDFLVIFIVLLKNHVNASVHAQLTPVRTLFNLVGVIFTAFSQKNYFVSLNTFL